MPRTLKLTKKRKGIGGRKIVRSNNDESEAVPVPECEGTPRPRPPSTRTSQQISSSSKKIQLDKYKRFLTDDDYENEIVNMNILSDQLFSSSLCKECKQNGLQMRATKHFGLAFEMEIFCSHCKYVHKFNSSEAVTTSDKNKLFDVNIRMVYGLRSVGKGMAAGRMLCGIMNLPQPPTKILPYNKLLKGKAELVLNESMRDAVEEAVEENKILVDDSSEGNQRDLKAGIDGTWQRRGFSSLNGIVTCSSVDTGKIIDVEVLSKFCTCLDKGNHEETCSANYHGSSGGMEAAGALKIFRRSEDKYNVRYTQYLGDGDTNSYKTISDSKPYGDDVTVTKLECIGHIQKRMGARLRNLKKKSKGVKLSDGLPLGGRNRLTDGLIDELQSYYGNAIRQNLDSLKNMKEAVWATYFHKLSTDAKPEHGLCPRGRDSWCKFNKAKALKINYSHKRSIPEPIMLAIKPTFRALANPELLRKCLHGKTQNVNESVNNVIWSRVPKKSFVTITTLALGTYDAIATFNDGNITKCNILKAVGIHPSKRTVHAMKLLDCERVRRANAAINDYQRKARREARNLKRRLEENFDEEEEPAYDPGMH